MCLPRFVGLLSSLLLLPAGALAEDFELLTNGGFETGNLSGWAQDAGMGHVVAVSGSTAPLCAQITPNTPRTGSFLFSSSTQDGAIAYTPKITISQEIDISGFPGVSSGSASIAASGFFSGAMGCSGSTSDDLAEIVVEFYSGGPSGMLLGSTSSGALDPVVGSWNPLGVSAPVPSTADTIIMRVRTSLDPGFAAIDIGVDDASLVLSVPPSVPIMGASSLGLLAAIVLGVARRLIRRSA